MTSRLIPLILSVTLCACASTSSPVRVDQAASVDLAKCRTFDWLSPSKEAASLTEQRVRAAALRELERKGYTLAAEHPDCRISYVFTTSERPQEKPRVGVGAGGGSRGIGGGIGISLPVGQRDRFGGTLVLDIVDVASNSQIWSGAVDASFREQELSDEDARAVVSEILSQFPDRGERRSDAVMQ